MSKTNFFTSSRLRHRLVDIFSIWWQRWCLVCESRCRSLGTCCVLTFRHISWTEGNKKSCDAIFSPFLHIYQELWLIHPGHWLDESFAKTLKVAHSHRRTYSQSWKAGRSFYLSLDRRNYNYNYKHLLPTQQASVLAVLSKHLQPNRRRI